MATTNRAHARTHATTASHAAGISHGSDASPTADSGTAGESHEGQRPDHGPSGVNQEALGRMKSVEGQVRGITRMIEEERYCIDIVDQIASARAALAKVSEQILRRHIETCVVRDLSDGSATDRQRVVDELMTTFSRGMK